MAIFSNFENKDEWAVFQMMRYGAVTMFHWDAILDKKISFLTGLGYQVHEFNCLEQSEEKDLLCEIIERLGVLPDWAKSLNTMSLNSFNDFLWDYEVPEANGSVLVLHHFDQFHNKDAVQAHGLLDVLHGHYSQNLLVGRRFFVLVQTDAKLPLKSLGGYHPLFDDEDQKESTRRYYLY